MKLEIQTYTSGVLPLSEPVPIFHREEVKWGGFMGGDAVYIARLMLNLNDEAITADYAKSPQKHYMNDNVLDAKLYPIPAKDEIKIEFNKALVSNARIEIFGFSGNLILDNLIISENQAFTISLKGLKAGIYFYKITCNDKIISKDKLLIIK